MPERADRVVLVAVLAVVATVALLLPQLDRFASPGPVFLVVLGLLWLAVFTAACAGLGWPVARLLAAASSDSLDGWVVALATGAGALTALAWLLSLLHLLRPAPLLAVLAAAALAGAWSLARGRTPWPEGVTLPAPALAAAAVVGGCTFLTALTLAPLYDQWHQHLGFPYQWLRHGSYSVMPRNFYSLMPANMSLLYGYALAALGPWAAQLVHWWMGALAVAGVACLGRRLGGDAAAGWGATLFLATPTTAALATTALSDLGIAGWGAAAWVAVVSVAAAGCASALGPWALAGALVGLAVGCKYTALSSVALPVALAAAAILGRRHAGRALRPALARLATLTGTACVAFSPWAVHNLALTGNPLFPYFARLFGALTGRDQGQAAEVARWIGDLQPGWESVRSGLLLGAFTSPGDGFAPQGTVLLSLLPAAAVLLVAGRLRPLAGSLAIGAAAGVAAWVPGLHCTRYLLPALLPAFALVGAALAALLPGLGRAARAGLVALVGLLATWNLSSVLTATAVTRLGCSLGAVSQDDTLRPYVSHWDALRFVNQDLPADARLLLVAEARALLLDRDVELEHAVHEPLLVELAESEPDAAAMAHALRQRGITHLLVNLHEARRMAAMAHREEYFATSSAAASERLERFFAEQLEPLWQERGVSVYRLR